MWTPNSSPNKNRSQENLVQPLPTIPEEWRQQKSTVSVVDITFKNERPPMTATVVIHAASIKIPVELALLPQEMTHAAESHPKLDNDECQVAQIA